MHNGTLHQIIEQCPIAYKETIEADITAFSRSLDSGADSTEIQTRTIEYARYLVEQATAGHAHLQKLIEATSADEEAYRAERQALWQELQPNIIESGDILLIKIGDATWKLPATAVEFVKQVLPVFAKKQRQGHAIYKSIGSDDIGVHRLFVRAYDDERVGAFDKDFTNFCTIKSRRVVERNFGLTPPQLSDPKFVARYPDQLVPNLYILNSAGNPSHRRAQADFERRAMMQLALYNPHNKITPNADLGARAGTPNGIQDAGKYRPPTAREIESGGFDSIGYIERPLLNADPLLFKPNNPPRSAKYRRAAEALDKLFKD